MHKNMQESRREESFLANHKEVKLMEKGIDAMHDFVNNMKRAGLDQRPSATAMVKLQKAWDALKDAIDSAEPA